MIHNRFRLALILCLPLLLRGQSLQDFEKRVTEFTLKNGMHFIVLERHDAPVVAFHAYVDAGSVNDPGGKTGLAHMFEHMIGKGTVSVGTKNWPEEQKTLKAIEEAYDRLDNEKWKGPRANAEEVKKLEAALKALIDKANGYVESNAYPRVIEENGGVGFNAGTSTDSTVYFYSLPSNRSELWFLLASEWFKRPVFREFYKERDVVREERRMRVESSPQGKILEMMLATSFTAFPYRTTVGWASDIENLRAKDAEAFYLEHYAPGNITFSMAGDISPAQARALAEKYFAPIPARPMPEPVITAEPVQEGEKRVVVESPAQPFLLMGYKRPGQRHKDDPVFDVLSAILSSGRTGLLYKDMVRDKKIALAAAGIASFPGSKYPHMFAFFSVPTVGHTIEENEKAIYETIERLKKETVDDETLTRVKTKVRAGLIRQLDSNSGLASQLATFHVNYGSWKVLFTGIEDINKVTADDVQRVAREYFNEKNRTVAYTVKPGEEKKGDSK
jgi:predicted Zn-dependent peptidase